MYKIECNKFFSVAVNWKLKSIGILNILREFNSGSLSIFK